MTRKGWLSSDEVAKYLRVIADHIESDRQGEKWRLDMWSHAIDTKETTYNDYAINKPTDLLNVLIHN